MSFDVGLQHALKPTKTPEDDDITAPIDISDEDMTVAPMETLDRVTPMHPRRQDVRDPIRYIQVGKGLLADTTNVIVLAFKRLRPVSKFGVSPLMTLSSLLPSSF